MDEWTAQWEEPVNKLNQSLSVVQGAWAVLLIIVATASAIANEHLRVVQLEWSQTAERQASATWRGEMQATLKEMNTRLGTIEVGMAEVRTELRAKSGARAAR